MIEELIVAGFGGQGVLSMGMRLISRVRGGLTGPC